jgi:transcriptional regulator with XRE-family HTH domain
MGFKENLKAELVYQDIQIKELSALSGVSRFSISGYLNGAGKLPSVEAAVKIASVLGVSVEYLVMGNNGKTPVTDLRFSNDVRKIARLSERLDEQKREFVLDFIKWIKKRDTVKKRNNPKMPC